MRCALTELNVELGLLYVRARGHEGLACIVWLASLVGGSRV